jgi:hypothetical protein
MTEKAPNYTEEMVARLNAVYDGEADEDSRRQQVEDLAVELNRKPASIRAKLASEGLYVPYAKAPAKAPTVRKADLVHAIAKAMKVDEDVIGSLEKATKVALVKVLSAVS